ncbi:MAG: hypothetical protein QXJ99_02005 [Thermofilum sp.]
MISRTGYRGFKGSVLLRAARRVASREVYEKGEHKPLTERARDYLKLVESLL